MDEDPKSNSKSKGNSNSNSEAKPLAGWEVDLLGPYADEIDYAEMWNEKCQDGARQVAVPLSTRLHARLERLIDSDVLTLKRWLAAIEASNQNGSMPSFDEVLASVEAAAKKPPAADAADANNNEQHRRTR
jgi:hypothetical protein